MLLHLALNKSAIPWFREENSIKPDLTLINSINLRHFEDKAIRIGHLAITINTLLKYFTVFDPNSLRGNDYVIADRIRRKLMSLPVSVSLNALDNLLLNHSGVSYIGSYLAGNK